MHGRTYGHDDLNINLSSDTPGQFGLQELQFGLGELQETNTSRRRRQDFLLRLLLLRRLRGLRYLLPSLLRILPQLGPRDTWSYKPQANATAENCYIINCSAQYTAFGLTDRKYH